MLRREGGWPLLTIDEIRDIIPHRFPFLLIDRIEEVEYGKSAVGIKNVTANEPFFQGHFPDYPVMPGVLIIEALAQVGAIAALGLEENAGKIALFAGINKVRFRRQVRPGDQLRLEVELGRMRRGVGMGTGRASVDGDVAAEGELMFAVVDRDSLG